jgi:ATP-dependent RNA helicase RhlE
MNSFSELGLIDALQRAVHDEGYSRPTPIQAQSIPHVLAGRDLLGCAQTGTGKTAAFALPILQRFSSAHHRPHARATRALVLVPTRELAAQVGESFATYGAQLKLTSTVIFGGVGQGAQVRALSRGVDILVATPGRLLDLFNQKHVRLDAVEILVLDEADHMLDLGFIPDVRRVLSAVPKKRQTLFFSATMPPPIAELARGILHDPVHVTVTPPASTVDEIDQSVHFVARAAKPDVLAHLLSDRAVERALVFTRTKHGADRVARRLTRDGIPAQAIHGNKSQGQRERTMHGFRGGRTRVLVATDIAARGIDVDGITHVINYELPNVPEVYVHRIGRTGRAGARGVAISLVDGEERENLRDIEKLIRRSVPVAAGSKSHPEPVRHAHHPRAHAAPKRHPHAERPRGHHAPHRAEHRPPRKHEHHRPGRSKPAGHRHHARPAPPPRAHQRDDGPQHTFGAGI